MATLTTLELLSPPEDVAREARVQIAMAHQQDASNQPELMAAAFTTNFTVQSVDNSDGVAQRSFAGSSAFPSSSSGTGETFSDSLANPEVTKRAYDDIRALADLIRSARKSFQMVELVVKYMSTPIVVMIQGFPTSVAPGGGELSSKWWDIRQVCAVILSSY